MRLIVDVAVGPEHLDERPVLVQLDLTCRYARGRESYRRLFTCRSSALRSTMDPSS